MPHPAIKEQRRGGGKAKGQQIRRYGRDVPRVLTGREEDRPRGRLPERKGGDQKNKRRN